MTQQILVGNWLKVKWKRKEKYAPCIILIHDIWYSGITSNASLFWLETKIKNSHLINTFIVEGQKLTYDQKPPI